MRRAVEIHTDIAHSTGTMNYGEGCISLSPFFTPVAFAAAGMSKKRSLTSLRLEGPIVGPARYLDRNSQIADAHPCLHKAMRRAKPPRITRLQRFTETCDSHDNVVNGRELILHFSSYNF